MEKNQFDTFKYKNPINYLSVPTYNIQKNKLKVFNKSNAPAVAFKTTAANQNRIKQTKRRMTQLQQKQTKLKIAQLNSKYVQKDKNKMNVQAAFCTHLSKLQFGKARNTFQEFNYKEVDVNAFRSLYNQVVSMALQIEFLNQKCQSLQNSYKQFVQNTNAQVLKMLDQGIEKGENATMVENTNLQQQNRLIDQILQHSQDNSFEQAFQKIDRLSEQRRPSILKMVEDAYLNMCLKQLLQKKEQIKHPKNIRPQSSCFRLFTQVEETYRDLGIISKTLQMIQIGYKDMQFSNQIDSLKCPDYSQSIRQSLQTLDAKFKKAKDQYFSLLNTKKGKFVKSQKKETSASEAYSKIISMLRQSKFVNEQYIMKSKKTQQTKILQIVKELLSIVNLWTIKINALNQITKPPKQKNGAHMKSQDALSPLNKKVFQTVNILHDISAYIDDKLEQFAINSSLFDQLNSQKASKDRKEKHFKQQIKENFVKVFEQLESFKELISDENLKTEIRQSKKKLINSIEKLVHTQIKDIYPQLKMFELLVQYLNNLKQAIQGLKQKHQKENKKLEDIINSLRQQLKTLQKEIQDINNQNTSSDRNLDIQKKLLQQQIKRIQGLKDGLDKDISTLKEQNEKISQDYEKDRKTLQKRIFDLTHKQTIDIESQFETVQSEIQTQTEHTQQTLTQTENRSQYEKILRINLFGSSSIIQTPQQKVSFLNLLGQKVSGREIRKMNLLYKMDTLSKISPYAYITGKKNIILCIKTEKGVIIGGFSQTAFQKQPKYKENDSAFLFKFDQQKGSFKTYDLIKGKRSIKEDSKYIIFGNSEIRIDLAKNSVTSNFGTKRVEYHNPNNETIEAFLQEGKTVRQAKIQYYELYNVDFCDEQVADLLKEEKVVRNIEPKKEELHGSSRRTQNASSTDKFQEDQETMQQIALQQQLRQKQFQTENLMKNIEQIEKQIKLSEIKQAQFTKQLQGKTVQIASLERSNDLKAQLLRQLNIQLEEKNRVINSTNQQIQAITKEKELLQKKIKQMSNNRQKELQQQVIDLRSQISVKDLQLKKNSEQLKGMKEFLNEKERLNSLLSQLKAAKQTQQSNNKILQQQINTLTQSLNESNNQITQNRSTNLEMKNKIQELQFNCRNLNRENQQLQKKVSELESEKSKMSGKVQRLRNFEEGTQRFEKFFVGEIFDFESMDKRSWLIKKIEKQNQRYFRRTKLLYRFDKLSKVNFHQYIDNNQHVILLVKTDNNKVIGGYTKESFTENRHSTDYGMIFSLTEKIYFQRNVKNNSYKANTYDEFYIIFGNLELRIKTQEEKVFSNFAILHNFYETKGHSVDILLGKGEKGRDDKIITYQVYSIQFGDRIPEQELKKIDV